MEFGLGESLPLYAGGLGILAGDHLKTASDLGVPVVGVGLLYQDGYFRQIVDAAGWQHEMLSRTTIRPACPSSRSRRGRRMAARLARISRTDDPPARLARAGGARRPLPARQQRPDEQPGGPRHHRRALRRRTRSCACMQEIVLGVGGLAGARGAGLDVDVCHLNEGHAAFARARARAPLPRAARGRRSATRSAPRAPATSSRPTRRWRPASTRSRPRSSRSTCLTSARTSRKLGISLEELLALGREDPARRDRAVQHGLPGHARLGDGRTASAGCTAR